MSHLIAITFDERKQALRARTEFAGMQREHLVELEDCAVVYKDRNGRVKIDQTVNLASLGAVEGGFWGLLIGLLFSIPFGGPLLPAITAVFGASFGALGGSLRDYGIDDRMMKELGAKLDQGRTALFVLVRHQTVDKVLNHLRTFRGEILQTSLPQTLEDRFAAVLRHDSLYATGAHGPAKG